MKTSEDTSLEKYTSHFIWKGSKGLLKVLLWEGVGDRTELQHIDPHPYSHNGVSFPFSWVAQPGAWGPSLSGTCSSFQHLLSNYNCSIGGLRAHSAGYWFSLPHLISNSLNFLCTELYNCSTSTFFLWASQIALIQPVHGHGYILIFLDRMHLLFTRAHFLFWQPGRVGGQYITPRLWKRKKNFSRGLPRTKEPKQIYKIMEIKN